MQLLSVVILLLLFAILILWSVSSTKAALTDDNATISYVLTALNYLICAVICVFFARSAHPFSIAQPTDFEGNALTLMSTFGVIFVWWVFAMLSGAIFASLSGSIAMIAYIVKNGTAQMQRGFIPPGFSSGTISGLCAGSIATAFTILLCVFSNSSAFFPIAFS